MGGGFLSRIYWVDDESAGLRRRKKKGEGLDMCVRDGVEREKKRGVEAVRRRR